MGKKEKKRNRKISEQRVKGLGVKVLKYLRVKIMDLELAKPKSSMIDLIPTFGCSGASGLDELLRTTRWWV